MGEGIGNEEQLMPFISSANIACVYHAGDEATMQRVVELCLEHKVNIGAHPSFPDREHFGRTEMQLSMPEVYLIVTDQLNMLNDIVKRNDAVLHHVKPHGALYNMAAKNVSLAKIIAQAVKDFDPSLVYYGLSGSVMIKEAIGLGLQTANEVFADRTYQRDGSLTPRSRNNALLNKTDDVIKQVTKLVKENKVIAVTGEEIMVKADTVCIHGDGKQAVEFAKAIYQQLYEK
jgi:UPF0271 protein